MTATDRKPDAELIAEDIALLHRVAEKAAGRIVLASFGEDPKSGDKLRPVVETSALARSSA